MEVDLLKSFPGRIWIGNGDYGGFWQLLVPENIPRYCSHCFRQGHDQGDCRLLHPVSRSDKGQLKETTEAQGPRMKDVPAEAQGHAPAMELTDAQAQPWVRN